MPDEHHAQLDREVEEFRRRLESANTHNTKSKLTPILFLGDVPE